MSACQYYVSWPLYDDSTVFVIVIMSGTHKRIGPTITLFCFEHFHSPLLLYLSTFVSPCCHGLRFYKLSPFPGLALLCSLLHFYTPRIPNSFKRPVLKSAVHSLAFLFLYLVCVGCRFCLSPASSHVGYAVCDASVKQWMATIWCYD